MKKRRFVPGVLLAIVLMAPLLAGACGSTIRETIDDATITTRVKTAYINDPLVGGLRIDVETFNGVVTLTGRVKSPEEEAKAMALARTIRGVAAVKSTLQIEP